MASHPVVTGSHGSIQEPMGTFNPEIPQVLPHREMFRIQVGESLFRLSGASLSSDSPSYFTNFFLPYIETSEDKRPTLYLDRDPAIFRLVCSHLQGYYSSPSTHNEFTYLVVDANYYHLPRLMKQLSSNDIYISIGGRSFRVPRDMFSNPGDSPNFFTSGYMALFGNDQMRFTLKRNLIRPPPIAPATVTNRSAELFADIMLAFRGSPLEIRSEDHRDRLIKECRYYRFRGLEQRLIAVKIEYNPVETEEEITIGYGDIKLNQKQCFSVLGNTLKTPLRYQRPFMDEAHRQLIVQFKNIQGLRIFWDQSLDSATLSVENDELVKFFQGLVKVLDLNKADPPVVTNSALPRLEVDLDDAFLSVDGIHDINILETIMHNMNAAGKRTRPHQLDVRLAASQFKVMIQTDLEGKPCDISLQLLQGRGYTSITARNKLRDLL